MGTATEPLQRWIETLPEPDWLSALRRSAAAIEAQSAIPHWDRTDARGLDAAALPPPGGGELEIRLPDGAAAQGVICAPISELAVSRPDLVRRHLGQGIAASSGRFEARNAAAHQGCLLHVPDRVVLAGPVEIVYRLDGGARQFHPRTVIALGRTAEASVVQREEGGPQAPGRAVVTAVVEAQLQDGAQLRFVDLQDWAGGVSAFASRHADLGRDAHVEWLIGELGAGLLRSATTSLMASPGAETLALVVFFGSASQHMDIAVTLRHAGEHTIGNMLTKGVLSGHARAIYRGTSDIARGARDSNSQQKENVLHLGSGVRSDAIPALYINENQLQAGHAATTGRVDEEQMFYMTSRGLPPLEAQRLIVHGFFEPLLRRVPLAAVRERLTELIDRKIG